MEKKVENKEGRNIGFGIPIPPKPEEYDENDPFYGKLLVKKGSVVGNVVSVKRARTATIAIERLVKDKKFSRIYKKKTKMHVHNPSSIEAKEGDVVRAYETRPLSKTKNHVIVQVIGKHIDIKGQDLTKEEPVQEEKATGKENTKSESVKDTKTKKENKK
ncbi:MAG: 30S ribosomal protein S17 [Nanobdellota archaeon]